MKIHSIAADVGDPFHAWIICGFLWYMGWCLSITFIWFFICHLLIEKYCMKCLHNVTKIWSDTSLGVLIKLQYKKLRPQYNTAELKTSVIMMMDDERGLMLGCSLWSVSVASCLWPCCTHCCCSSPTLVALPSSIHTSGLSLTWAWQWKLSDCWCNPCAPTMPLTWLLPSTPTIVQTPQMLVWCMPLCTTLPCRQYSPNRWLILWIGRCCHSVFCS